MASGGCQNNETNCSVYVLELWCDKIKNLDDLLLIKYNV